MEIQLAPEHGYVFLVAIGIALQCLLSCMPVMKARKKVFGSKDFQERKKVQQLNDEHKAATGDKSIPKLGYPDMGSGRYSEALTYEEWFHLNNAQRAHYNNLEFLPAVELLVLISGMFYPVYTSVVGCVYLVARVLYTFGYQATGPKGRTAGAILGDITLLVLVTFSIMGSLSLTGLIPDYLASKAGVV